jgi:hypothetical protein
MQKILLIIMILLGASAAGKAQPGNAATALAAKIANKMRDSLSLTGVQRNQIYAINLQLHSQKQAVRQMAIPADSIAVKIQQVERTRDSLYKPITGPAAYIIYKQKKRNLVSN